MADAQTLQVFLNVFLRSACFSDDGFSGESKPSGLGLVSSSARLLGFPNYWISD
jgi:hypothetical protein